MWILDLSTQAWQRVALPHSLFKNTRTDPAAHTRVVQVVSHGTRFFAFTSKYGVSVSVDGDVSPVVKVGNYDLIGLPRRLIVSRGPHFGDSITEYVCHTPVDLGVYICIFNNEFGSQSIYMVDTVSGDAVLAKPLPFPGRIEGMWLLNPTTMLVVQTERTLLVELDPQLFNRFADD
ncbi:hypothetical protein KIPB_005631 [Kipferlia bialata]|uniref:Uncharacterized protein n=1 Tax=Kipferlia bialata TaxID=797122 RepID=A0A391NLG6_9EUKA|nr:hypothetical protein KIPB_002582 [Kipferlia bialata]GCA62761.1 hypothetical protein KIPB_005631 [Kipferlia bialata]|eukprot:g2582.t1